MLCVEPTIGLRRVLRGVLDSHVDLEFASTAAEAIARLQAGSAIHIVLAELKLDDASGLALLGGLQQSRPHITRILLSSERGVTIPDDAVRAAGVFRVLTLPTTVSVMLSAVRDGFQASMHAAGDATSDRDHILNALVAASTVLSTAPTAIVGRAERIARHVRDLASVFGHQSPQMLELAAMACEVGLIDGSQERGGTAAREAEAAGDVARRADDWLSMYPGTEHVRAIVAATFAAEQSDAGVLHADVGMLRIPRHFEQLIETGLSASEALATMGAPAVRHDTALLHAFAALRAPASPTAEFALVSLDAIKTGMIFADDVKNSDGVLLVPRGHAVTAALYERMRNVWLSSLPTREFRMVVRANDGEADVAAIFDGARDHDAKSGGSGTTARFGPNGSLDDAQESGATWHVLSQAMASAYDGVMITEATLDAPGPRIVFVNAAFERMSGWSAAELLTRTPRVLQGPATERDVLARLRDTLSRGEAFQGSTVNYRRDGSPFIMEWSINPLHDRDGILRHYVAVQRDITAFRSRIDESEESVCIDALTGLANRRGYENRLAALVAQPDAALGLLAINVDRFRDVNDAYGHDAGDAVLVEVGRRMASVATHTPDALLARTGGKEFSLLTPSPDSRGGVAVIGEAMRTAVSARPIVMGATSLTVTISVGAATDRPPRLGGSLLAISADRALNRAKRAGRNRVEQAGDDDASA